MKTKFTILIVLALVFASATQAQGNYRQENRRDHRARFDRFQDRRFDHPELRRDIFHKRNCF
jgi:hypothetical protein